jgi:hypothetical protein
MYKMVNLDKIGWAKNSKCSTANQLNVLQSEKRIA